MAQKTPVAELSFQSYLVLGIILLGTSYQLAFVKIAYNVPFKAIEQSLLHQNTSTRNWCILGSCDSEIWTTVFWTLLAMVEPLGAMPAVLTGYWCAERYGKHFKIAISETVLD